MPDMLVKLYDLPDDSEDIDRLKDEGITIRRVASYETSALRRFVLENFSELWADEAMIGCHQHPRTTFIATHEKKIIGFACHECTRRGFFGPTGVLESYRGKGVGKALYLACLHAMREMGYAYAIIGGAGPTGFYEKCSGATVIPDSKPGIYTDMLDRSP